MNERTTVNSCILKLFCLQWLNQSLKEPQRHLLVTSPYAHFVAVNAGRAHTTKQSKSPPLQLSYQSSSTLGPLSNEHHRQRADIRLNTQETAKYLASRFLALRPAVLVRRSTTIAIPLLRLLLKRIPVLTLPLHLV